MSDQVQIGTTVVYYECGDVSGKPTAAIIVDYNEHDRRLELALIAKNTETLIRRHNVYHTASEIPNEKTRVKYGTWESLEESRVRIEESDAVRKARVRKAQQDREKFERMDHERFQVMKLHDTGKKPGEIAAEVGGDWTAMSVGRFIKSRTKERVTAGSDQ